MHLFVKIIKKKFSLSFLQNNRSSKSPVTNAKIAELIESKKTLTEKITLRDFKDTAETRDLTFEQIKTKLLKHLNDNFGAWILLEYGESRNCPLNNEDFSRVP